MQGDKVAIWDATGAEFLTTTFLFESYVDVLISTPIGPLCFNWGVVIFVSVNKHMCDGVWKTHLAYILMAEIPSCMKWIAAMMTPCIPRI